MINLAGGSVFLGVIAFSVSVLFYFQPTVEAVVSTNHSPNNLQIQINNQDDQTIQQKNQDNQDNQIIQQPQQTQVQTSNINSDNKGRNLSEATSYRATAYCLQGRTANGGSVRRGIVAADPRVLPLGSRIQLSAGAYSGTYTVTDTGGAVKGRKLDIWVPSCSEAMRFGRRSVTVSRLGRNG
jgi:3D (Asp-Asp-Asp) domain-containing protein